MRNRAVLVPEERPGSVGMQLLPAQRGLWNARRLLRESAQINGRSSGSEQMEVRKHTICLAIFGGYIP